MGSDDIFDILLLFFVIAILTPIMLKNTLPLFKGDIGGFETLEESTTQKINEEKKPVDDSISKDDLLLMVVVADKTATKPSILQLAVDKNDDGIVNDSSNENDDELSEDILLDRIINNKADVLRIIDSYVPYGTKLKLYTLVGSNGIEKWVVRRG
jgi:hypothetical protein